MAYLPMKDIRSMNLFDAAGYLCLFVAVVIAMWRHSASRWRQRRA
jgi:hypothetical protein